MLIIQYRTFIMENNFQKPGYSGKFYPIPADTPAYSGKFYSARLSVTRIRKAHIYTI